MTTRFRLRPIACLSQVLSFIAVFAGSVADARPAHAQLLRRPVALRHARIMTMDGAVIEDGTLLIQGDRIAAVGATVKPIFTDGKFSGTEPSAVVLVSFPLAYLIASFFLMSAIAHFLAGWPLRARYGLAPPRHEPAPLRRVRVLVQVHDRGESRTSSYMNQFTALVAIAGVTPRLNLFGWTSRLPRTKAATSHDSNASSSAASPDHPVDHDLLGRLALVAQEGCRRVRRPHVRLRHHRRPVRRLRHLRDHDGPPVPEGRPLARVPVRREDVHDPQPRREVTPRLAALVGHAAP